MRPSAPGRGVRVLTCSLCSTCPILPAKGWDRPSRPPPPWLGQMLPFPSSACPWFTVHKGWWGPHSLLWRLPHAKQVALAWKVTSVHSGTPHSSPVLSSHPYPHTPSVAHKLTNTLLSSQSHTFSCTQTYICALIQTFPHTHIYSPLHTHKF